MKPRQDEITELHLDGASIDISFKDIDHNKILKQLVWLSFNKIVYQEIYWQNH